MLEPDVHVFGVLADDDQVHAGVARLRAGEGSDGRKLA